MCDDIGPLVTSSIRRAKGAVVSASVLCLNRTFFGKKLAFAALAESCEVISALSFGRRVAFDAARDVKLNDDEPLRSRGRSEIGR